MNRAGRGVPQAAEVGGEIADGNLAVCVALIVAVRRNSVWVFPPAGRIPPIVEDLHRRRVEPGEIR